MRQGRCHPLMINCHSQPALAHPKEYTSDAFVALSPCITSGASHLGFIAAMLQSEEGRGNRGRLTSAVHALLAQTKRTSLFPPPACLLLCVASDMILLRPMSVTLTCHPASTSRLGLFKSRWMMGAGRECRNCGRSARGRSAVRRHDAWWG